MSAHWIDVRLVGGTYDGQIHRVAANGFGQPPAAYGATPAHWITEEVVSAMATLTGEPEDSSLLPVVRSDYFHTGAGDDQYRPVYVHKDLNGWWGAPNLDEVPPEPWEDVWGWVRYVGGELDGRLDRLPERFTRWQVYRKARVRDQHGVMIYLCQDLRMWTT